MGKDMAGLGLSVSREQKNRGESIGCQRKFSSIMDGVWVLWSDGVFGMCLCLAI